MLHTHFTGKAGVSPGPTLHSVDAGVQPKASGGPVCDLSSTAHGGPSRLDLQSPHLSLAFLFVLCIMQLPCQPSPPIASWALSLISGHSILGLGGVELCQGGLPLAGALISPLFVLLKLVLFAVGAFFFKCPEF